MGIVARIVVLGLLLLLMLTPPGQQIFQTGLDWMSEKATEWTTDRIEEQQESQELRERLRAIEPVCGGGMKPEGFDVTLGQAVALVVGEREIDCDRLDVEPMVDAGWWAVHLSPRQPGGCEFSAEVDAETGEVSNRHRDCD